MFFHEKKLMFDVKVDNSDAQFAQMLLEQFGGVTGELSAALTLLDPVLSCRGQGDPRHAARHRDRGV
jgi:manganese catalase